MRENLRPMSIARLSAITVAVAALASPAAHGEQRAPATADCTRQGVAALVREFVTAYNDGDAQKLEEIWAQEPHFNWYFVQGERQEDAEDRSTLGAYFAARHAVGDTLVLRELSVKPKSEDGSFGFGFSLTRRSNDPSARGRFHGKGSARGPGEALGPELPDPNSPSTCVLHVWSMGRDVSEVGARTYTRACEDSVHGDLGSACRQHSIVAGRLAFVGARGYRDAPRRWFRKRNDGSYRTQKILVRVENGDDVTVRIPRRHRRRAALVYDRSLFNRRLRISDADYRVNFDVCEDAVENPHGAEDTQYNGGFLVARARCVPVDVLTARGDLIKRVRISFGAGRCRR